MNAHAPHARKRKAAPLELRPGEGWNEATVETSVGPVKVRWRGDRRDVATAMLRNAMQMMSHTHGRSIARR